jgi:hypothetical protein
LPLATGVEEVIEVDIRGEVAFPQEGEDFSAAPRPLGADLECLREAEIAFDSASAEYSWASASAIAIASSMVDAFQIVTRSS